MIQSGQATAIGARNVSNDNGQIIAQGGDLTISGGLMGDVRPPGPIHAVALFTQNRSDVSDLNNYGGRLQANGSLSVFARNLSNQSGTILTTDGDISLASRQGMLAMLQNDGGTLQAGRDLTIRAQSFSGISSLTVNGSLALQLGQGLAGQYVFSAGRDVTLLLDGSYQVASGGGVLAGGDATINASAVQKNGVLLAGSALHVTSAGQLYNVGLITGAGGVNLEVGGDVNNIGGAVLNRSGLMQTGSATGDISVRAASLVNDILGGVQFVADRVIHDRTYRLATDQLANPPALNPEWKDYRSINKYYNHVMKIYVPEAWRAADGSAGKGYYLVALDRGDSASYVRVRGTGSSATASNASALIAAGRNLMIETRGGVRNDASHLTSGADMLITGASLTNIGYKNEILWELTQNSPKFKRWLDPSNAEMMLHPDASAASNSAGYPGIGAFNGGPRTQVWGTSTGNALTGTIVAGGNLVGDVTGNIDNNSVVVHANAVQIAGNNLGPAAPGNDASAAGRDGQAAGGGQIDIPTAGQVTPTDTSISGGASSQSAGGGALPGGTGTDSRVAGAASGGSAPSAQSSGLAPSGGGINGESMQAPIYGGLINPNIDASGAATAAQIKLPGFVEGRAAQASDLVRVIAGGSHSL